MNLVLICLLSFISSIYQMTVETSPGTIVPLSNFQGKKLLLVNIASNSPRATQLAALQELQELYQDSLVIIAFPSNSFGNEPLTSEEVRAFCTSNYQASFFIASKVEVIGLSAHPVYQWLNNIDSNGVASIPVSGDFEKFLIDGKGELVGIFSGALSPMASEITGAIEAH